MAVNPVIGIGLAFVCVVILLCAMMITTLIYYPSASPSPSPSPSPSGGSGTGSKKCARTVTARRTDNDGGWGMDLQFMCGDKKVIIGPGHLGHKNTKTGAVIEGLARDSCPKTVDKSNWLGTDTHPDTFDITVSECVSGSDPCAGLTDTSLASSVPVSCLRKLLTDKGCTPSGTMWPDDDYDDWWRQSPQGTSTVYCDDQGTPCGAGNYATVKNDINAWATMTDDLRVKGCGRQ